MFDQPLKIACVGEAMIEMSLTDDADSAAIGFAGDTLNTAIYLRRQLDPAHEVAFVSVVGQDQLSERMLRFIADQGVATSVIRRDEARLPGIYAIATDDKGERSFSYWRDQSAARLLFQGGDFSALDGFDVVYLSAITLAILAQDVRDALFDWVEAFRAKGGLFAFDSNYRPRLWPDVKTAQDNVARAWRLADIGLPSVDDEAQLFGDGSEEATKARLEDYGIVMGALKRGASGPLPINAEVDRLPDFQPAHSVVDTTAAGDSFNGGFLAAHLSGASLADAMLAGHDLAAYVVGFRGAIAPKS
ncbi:sugar kinase [Qingshengfaniella alkalisoli]|uniref:Sugar kinase n=1 Tax=Qingshengfaniella alkalisoli TaxID=2599296 RepID=A0A5B8IA52_9RHOB|nr:sugar kinase [Qingshengfaniella alkalisoli]QDY70939.1 sugar kinase [Qingshengfaniella alkalisoli]